MNDNTKMYYRDIMKDYNYKKLRNVGLIGHGSTGKTSLSEALLFYTNNTDRLGKVEYRYQLQLLPLKKEILKLI